MCIANCLMLGVRCRLACMPEKNRNFHTVVLVLFAELAKFEAAEGFDIKQQCRLVDLLSMYRFQAMRLQLTPLTAVHHAGEHVYTCSHDSSNLTGLFGMYSCRTLVTICHCIAATCCS